MGAGVSWGETTTLLEFGTNDVAWTTEGLATWTAGGTPTIIENSYVHISGGNGSYETVKNISPTANAVINVTAVWRGRSDTGRTYAQGNGSYFRFGNIVVAQNDQDQKHGYVFNGLTSISSVTTFSVGSYRGDNTTGTWLLIDAEINTATNTLTSFTIKSEDGATTYVTKSDIPLSSTDYTTVAFGYKKNGSVSTSNFEDLKSIKITQTTQDVVVRGYTIKFQDASGNTLKDDITSRTGVVGTVIPITDSDKADFYTGEGDSRKKWTYASDNSAEESNKIAEDGSTVVIVKFNEVAKYNYSATTKAEETVLPYSYSGSQFKGETVKIPYPRYQLQSGTLYEKAATSNEYNYSFTLNSDNQEETITGYSDSEIENVIFYTEGEDIAGATRHTSTNAISTRSSASAVGTSDGALTIMNGLPAGKYKIVAAFYKNSSANVSTSFTIGSSVVNVSTNTSNTNLQEATSDEFVVSSASDVVWAGTGFLDYVYIQKTGDVTVPVSGLTDGEYVYTPQGRFQITGDVIARSNFYDFSGWEVITATDGKTVMDNFVIDPEGPADGVFSAVSFDTTAGEGMYFKFTPTDADATYIVSYKMKGAQNVTTRVKTVAVSTNLVKVEGNSDGVYGGTNDVLLCNTAEELSDEWQTFNYAIVGDGVPRTYFISFSGMSDNIYIADLQIAEAYQVADLRARDAALERVNVYKNAYAWSEEDLNDYGIYDALEILNAIGDQSSQAALNDALEAANEMLNEFRYSNMDDYLAGGDERNYLSNTFGVAGDSEASSYGVWNCIPSGRGHWAANAYPDMGHYQNGTTWNNGAPTTAQGVTTQMELTPGAYVFAIKSAAALREPLEQTWHTDDGMKPAYGIAYIAKVNGETVDIIASSEQKDLEPVKMTPFYVTANITEAGKYEFGMLAYCKEAYQSLELGSVTYVGDASIVGKSYSKYTQKQLAYEEDVREQITTGRNQLTIAAANLADEEKLWGKAELQACVDTVAPRIAAYETLTQDDIIATYEDYYEKTISNDNGIMVYGVYHFAVKDIIAANRRFNAVNDILASMQVAVDAAQGVLNERIYSAATGKEALQSEIAKVQDLQAEMKAADYSEENAAAIITANAELADAVETFKTSLPASAVTSLIDIDFANAAEQDQETLLYKISGTKGSMELSSYNAEGAAGQTSFEKGFWSNGEQLLSDVLRVGNGTGTVLFDTTNGTGSAGSDIVRVKFDMYYGYLSDKNAGFYIYNEDTEVAGLYISKYSNTEVTNTFKLNRSLIPAVGNSSANNDAICTESNKTHFEVIFDFGEKSMYCTTDANGRSQTSEKKPFNEAALTSFVVKSDYDYSSRRCWFDNLKIELIQTCENVTITSAGWATLYTPYALDFSTVEGLEAYTATVSDNTVTLTKVDNVPAGTGVVLKGEAKDYNIPVTANSETEKGSLEGSATEATAYDAFSGYKLYMLKKVGDNVQFVPMTSGSLAKGKAYLKIEQDNAGSGEAKALSVVFVNEPTGIKSVNSDETKVNGIYDLQGRRVSQPTKGLYIVNGKKVVIK